MVQLVGSTAERALMVDNVVEGFLTIVRDNDYTFYYEDNGGWVEAGSVRGRLLKGRRYKALRRMAVLTMNVPAGTFLLGDSTALLPGSLSVEYALGSNLSRVLALKPDEYEQAMCAAVSDALSFELSRYSWQEFESVKWRLKADINRQLSDTHSGFHLTVQSLSLMSEMAKVSGDEIKADFKAQKDAIRRMNDALVKLEIQRQQRRLDLEQERQRQQLKIEMINNLLQLPSEHLAPAIALIDPNAARVLADYALAQAQLHAQNASLQMMAQLLQRAQPGRVTPGSPLLPAPTAAQLPAPVAAVDPESQPYLELGYTHCRVTPTEIHLRYGQTYVTMKVRGGAVSSVLFGETDPPHERWNGPLTRDPVKVARNVLDSLKRDAERGW